MAADIIVVSDSYGFVGAFKSIGEAKDKVLIKYQLLPFLVQKFPLNETAGDNVWVIPYRDTNAVAFVSNDRDKALKMQKALQNVNLTYQDSIDYWEQPLGRVVPAADERMASVNRAHEIYASNVISQEEKDREVAAQELIQSVVDNKLESPIDRLIRENERITFLDCVVEIITDEYKIAVEPESEDDSEEYDTQ